MTIARALSHAGEGGVMPYIRLMKRKNDHAFIMPNKVRLQIWYIQSTLTYRHSTLRPISAYQEYWYLSKVSDGTTTCRRIK